MHVWESTLTLRFISVSHRTPYTSWGPYFSRHSCWCWKFEQSGRVSGWCSLHHQQTGHCCQSRNSDMIYFLTHTTCMSCLFLFFFFDQFLMTRYIEHCSACDFTNKQQWTILDAAHRKLDVLIPCWPLYRGSSVVQTLIHALYKQFYKGQFLYSK